MLIALGSGLYVVLILIFLFGKLSRVFVLLDVVLGLEELLQLSLLNLLRDFSGAVA